MTYRIVDEDTNEMLNSYSDETTLGEIREWLNHEQLVFDGLEERNSSIYIIVYRW